METVKTQKNRRESSKLSQVAQNGNFAGTRIIPSKTGRAHVAHRTLNCIHRKWALMTCLFMVFLHQLWLVGFIRCLPIIFLIPREDLFLYDNFWDKCQRIHSSDTVISRWNITLMARKEAKFECLPFCFLALWLNHWLKILPKCNTAVQNKVWKKW